MRGTLRSPGPSVRTGTSGACARFDFVRRRESFTHARASQLFSGKERRLYVVAGSIVILAKRRLPILTR